jgi:hypothetical protein
VRYTSGHCASCKGLLKAFELRGFSVDSTSEGVRLTILGERLGFGIEEGTKKIEHRVSFTDQKLIDRCSVTKCRSGTTCHPAC